MIKKVTISILATLFLVCACLACVAACNEKTDDPTAEQIYIVRFKNGGATHDVKIVSSLSDGTVTMPTDPEKTGYAFGGWYLDDSRNNPFAADTAITANTTVYAECSLVNYTITYRDPEGKILNTEGFDLPASYTIESDTITLNGYYLPGFGFNGWHDEDGTA